MFPELKDAGVHPKQLPVIDLIARREGINQRRICDYVDVRPSTVANMIGCLEKAGIAVKKTDAKDSRKTNIYLTEKGRRIAGRSKSYLAEREEIMLSGFDENEKMLLKKMLKQMIQNIQNETEP